MPEASGREIIMEKTPVYFNSPPLSIPEKIKNSVPNAKLILVVCDPVRRSLSDYIHEVIPKFSFLFLLERHLLKFKLCLSFCHAKQNDQILF